MTAMLATVIGGFVIGFVGQHSRMCFIGGIRDFILVRDAFMIKGLLAFLVVGWTGFGLVSLLQPASTHPSELSVAIVVNMLVGGAGVGLFSTLADGCPLRQHVSAAQGNQSAMAYLAGFFTGAWVFSRWVLPTIMAL
ncbi:YeeE/YedE thiosulfate transporter family protein [Kineobactrum salinum]|uniref:YeeE/YedE family protein n=1 Tax=Kineobactrum salinum TaxID=2708301 RepID=A0A6C0TYX1_9GAMM|nr:YeeE/YedE thiosulfate transporter family protein [Kineobactrum salinum]QIB64991.1 YeeE/YedE family protein [Kineobactrum salinum]